MKSFIRRPQGTHRFADYERTFRWNEKVESLHGGSQSGYVVKNKIMVHLKPVLHDLAWIRILNFGSLFYRRRAKKTRN